MRGSALLSLCGLVSAHSCTTCTLIPLLVALHTPYLHGRAVQFCAFAYISALGTSHFPPNQNCLCSSNLDPLNPSCNLTLSSSASQRGTSCLYLALSSSCPVYSSVTKGFVVGVPSQPAECWGIRADRELAGRYLESPKMQKEETGDLFLYFQKEENSLP